jgi:hypothetical protein
MGLVGPAGPALSSFDSLVGLPCTRNSQLGAIALTYSGTGDATFNCVLGGGGSPPPPPPPGPVLTSITTQAPTILGTIGLTVSTASPVSSDLAVLLSQAGQVQMELPGQVIIPAGSSSVSFAMVRIGSNAGATTITATAGTSSIPLAIQFPGPDFSCLGSSSTTAVDPLVVSGTVLSPVDGSLASMVGLAAGVLVEVHLKSDHSLVTSVTTDASGNFSLSLPTGGVPLDIYLVLSKSGFITENAYWSKPLAKATSSNPFVMRSVDETNFYSFMSIQQDPNFLHGTGLYSVTDCNGLSINEGTIVGDSSSFSLSSLVGFPLGVPSFWVFNQPGGLTNASFMTRDGSVTFGQTSFIVFSGQLTYVSITP